MSPTAVWIRGLHEAWSRMDPGTNVAKYIESYLLVQVRTILHCARLTLDLRETSVQRPTLSCLHTRNKLV